MSRKPTPPAARPQTAPQRKHSQEGRGTPSPSPRKGGGDAAVLSYDALVFKWARLHHAASQQDEEGESKEEEEDDDGENEDEVPAESVEYAQALVNYASTLCGVEVKSIAGKAAFRELTKPAPQQSVGSPPAKKKEATIKADQGEVSDDERRKEKTEEELAKDERKKEKAAKEEEERQEEIAQIEKQVAADSRSQKTTPLIALQRLRQSHQFLVRTLARVDDECQRQVYEQRTFALSKSDQKKGRHTRSTALLAGISSRMGRQRATYTKQALRAVTDMRGVVEKRKVELAKSLEQQEKETEERVRLAEAKRRTEQRLHDAQCREMERMWAEKKQREQDKKSSKKREDKDLLKATAALEGKTEEAAVRKYLYWAGHAGEVSDRRQARDDLYAHNTSLRRKHEEEDAEQAHQDRWQRNEAVRIRNVMQHTQAFDRHQQRLKHQENAYKSAHEQEEQRQKHIAEVMRQREEREERVMQQQLEQVRKTDQLHRRNQGNRDATFNNAQDIQHRRAKATDEMMSLRVELSKRHVEDCEKRMHLRRDYIKQQNVNRMELARQHASAIAFKDKTKREQWETRKEALEAQDKEISRMKDQLRQDKEKLAMQTQHLKLSQRKGDLKKLDRELERLDAALGREDEE